MPTNTTERASRPDHKAGSAALVIVTDRLPGSPPRLEATAGVTGLIDDPVTGALAEAAERWEGFWLGRPWLEPPTSWRVPMVAVNIDADVVSLYLDGHSRQTIWPLYHDLVRPAEYNRLWREAYRGVNRAFADSIAAEAGTGATVWIHDYHLQLLPAALRCLRPDLRIGFFLHTGFPAPDLFLRMPMRREIVTGILGADVIGFQTAPAAENFLRLTHELGLTFQDNAVGADGATKVGVYPTAVDSSTIAALAREPTVARRAAAIRADIGSPKIVVLSLDIGGEVSGVYRRLQVIGELLASGHISPADVAFVQVVSEIAEATQGKDNLRDRIGREIARINGQFASVDHPCVHYLVGSPGLAERAALYRAADVMMATPLCEGASLPAMEYIAARQGDGSLILSEFTGTATALPQALLVNPYDDNEVKSRLLDAIRASPSDQRRRMRPMLRYVAEYDNHAWSRGFLAALHAPPARVPVHTGARSIRVGPLTPHPRRRPPWQHWGGGVR